jgi:uncharacterized protein YegL
MKKRGIKLDPNETTTDILIILDRSGSMQHAAADHVGGLRAFVDEQRKVEGDVRLTLVQFDTIEPCEVIYDREPIASVGEITLQPRDGTPLFDAIGLSIAHFKKSRGAGDVGATNQVIVMIVTDGENNASKTWSKLQVKALVDELTAQDWAFVFLGANIDAFSTGQGMGMQLNAVMAFDNYDTAAIGSAYASTSANLMSARRTLYGGSTLRAASAAMSYTPAQRAAAKPEKPKRGPKK